MSEAAVYYILVQPEKKPESERLPVTEFVMSLEYEDNEKKADLLKLTVDNWDLRFFDDPVFKQGVKLIVSWGYAGRMAPPRECIIQKVTGGQTLQVEAQSKAVLLNKIVKSKTYENARRSEIVHALAKEHGYIDDETRDIEDTPETFPIITQARQTDAQFIKRLADLEGFEFYVDFDGFHWHARRMGQKPLRQLQYYLPPGVGDIKTFNIENDIFAKPGRVTAKGRDPLAKKDFTAVADNATVPRDVAAPQPEIVDPQTGTVTLGTNNASAETKPTTETSPTQAKREAAGTFKRTQQTTVKLDMELTGDPGILAKSVLDVRGLGKRLSGLYYVNQANHRVDSSGGYSLKVKCSTDGTKGHRESLVGVMGGSSGAGGGALPDASSIEAVKESLLAKQDELAVLLVNDPTSPKIPPLQAEVAQLQNQLGLMQGTKSAATVNPGETAPKDPAALEQVEKVDGQSGETTIAYVDKNKGSK